MLALGVPLVLAVAVSGSPVVGVPAVAVSLSAADASAPQVSEAPDAVAAMVRARAEGKRVEDLSQRTETSRVFANPEGTWTSESSPEPVRVLDEAGTWQNVDTNLVVRAGGLAPRYAATDVVFSDGGDKTFAKVSEAGRDLGWKWPAVLPAPEVEGDTATYAGAAPGGGDLVVTATSTGFTHSVVLHQAPAAAVDFTMPIATDGAELVEAPAGGLALETQAGKEIVTAPAPVMFDSSQDAGGLPENVAPVDTTIGQTPAGTATLTLAPDQEFLTDPETVYPVTVDPSFTTTATGDTWVQSLNYESSQLSSEELRTGTYDGEHKARSFLDFDETRWNGKHVVSADLKLRNWHARNCTAAQTNVYAATENWSGHTLTWANQPAGDPATLATYSPAHGVSPSCPDADATFDLTDIVQSWADGSRPNYGLRIRANNESNINSWRRYRSVNYATAGQRPRLETTYNSYPGSPWKPTVSPGTWYAAPGSATSNLYVADTTPEFTSKAREYDGDTVRMIFEVHNASTMSAGSKVGTCTTGFVASLSEASCTLAAPLVDGTKYWVRSYSDDGTLTSKERATSQWSPTTAFTVAAGQPAQPVIACPGYANDTWQTSAPAAPVGCTITGAGSGETAPAWIVYTTDGAEVENRVKIARSTSTSVAKTTTTLPATAGAHSIEAYTISASGVASDSVAFGFGSGDLALTAPVAGKVVKTASTVKIDAAGPPSGSTSEPEASVKWRVASSGLDAATGWNTIESDDLDGLAIENHGAAGIRVTGTWDTRRALHDTASDLDLDPRAPVLLEVQVCVAYPSSGQVCTWSESHVTVQRVPHAFDEGYPTTEAAGGQVALWTGEFATSETDVTVPGYTGSLSISRAHSSFDGPAANPAAGVFGPGWTAALDGGEAGAAGFVVYDDTLLDGTLALVDAEGATLTFGPPGTDGAADIERRTAANLAAGVWVPVDADTAAAAVRLEVSGVGAATEVALTDEAGTVTEFSTTTAPTATAAGEFVPKAVTEPGTAGSTSYTHDSQGRVTRILAPVPPGVTCPATGGLAALEPGCRALVIDYATTTTATEAALGDYAGQVRAIHADLFNPDKPGGAGMDRLTMTSYDYDDQGRLREVTDVRSGLATGYAYEGDSTRLASITDPGQAAHQLHYNAAEELTHVTRTRPASSGGGTATTTRVVYGIPVDGTGGSPDIAAAVNTWNQSAAPAHGYAVFGPDHEVSSSAPAALSASDYQHAELSYADARGYAVNTAVHGAGAWQYTATSYDTHGNVVRELDEGDIAAIRGGAAVTDMGTTTVYNTEVTATVDNQQKVVLPAGTVVTDIYGPARYATGADGKLAWLRPHSHTDYDQGAPHAGVNPATEQRYALPTTETTTAFDPATSTDVQTLSTVKTGYDPLGTPTTSEIDDAWAMGLASTATTAMPGGNDIVSKTSYDTAGRVTATRQPRSNGADAGTRESLYYTPGTHPQATACGTKPQWAGLPCLTRYAGPAAGGAELPVTQTTGYTAFGQPTTVLESVAGQTKRTTQTRYDTADRVSRTWTTSSLPDSTFAPGTAYTYDPDTGDVIGQRATDATGDPTGATITTDFDSWGRQTTYTPAPGETTTTSYDTAGRVATVTDPKGTTSYGYDGTDAAGRTEHRGLLTSLSVSNPAGRAVEFTGAYDAAGNLTTQTLPGGLTQQTLYDTAGEQTGLTYLGQTRKPDGSTSTGPWLGWSNSNDVAGRVTAESTPTGAAFGTAELDAGSSPAAGYDRTYDYDPAGRLITVTDRTAPAGSGPLDPTAEVGDPATADVVCQIRSYEFDTNGNRTGLNRATGHADGTCPAPGSPGSTTVTSGYDDADRLTTAGYVYDSLGRITQLPAADSPAGASTGAMSLAYYDTDAARTITQNGASTVFDLDPAGRRGTSTRTPTGGGQATVTERHYIDGSDNPAWTETTTGTSAPLLTRYAESLAGDLTALIDNEGTVILPLANPHGDTVTTTTLPGSGNTTSIDTWQSTDEYGNPQEPATTGQTPTTETNTGALGYGWLGAKQRATDGSGLILMGARLYNPATGTFTTTDPIFGGNTNAYGYPQDPINNFDLDGQRATCYCSAPWNRRIEFSWKKVTGKHRYQGANRGRRMVSRAPARHRAQRNALAGWRTGRELSLLGGKVRVGLGNKNAGNPHARKPHYHRAKKDVNGKVIPGQGKKRHRPWERKSTDKRIRDRL